MRHLFAKKKIERTHQEGAHKGLSRTLSVRDLTLLGIAAVIGAGIFSTIGKAAYEGGPGVIFLFIITAVTCGFTALCYAEFAARVPISGSAYTYAFVSFGELVAWIIGWSLILEYAIGNVVVAISWSSYLENILHAIGIQLPSYLMTDYKTASEAFGSGTQGTYFDAFVQAPEIMGRKVIMNLPAFLIVVFITILAYIGIKESKKSANAMVYFKLGVLALVIILGFFYIESDHYTPFMPHGFKGVLAGVSAVFYAYIGFDAISTTAEECKNPQRDLPRAMIYALVLCTIIYILIALVLTGMVSYESYFQVTDPLAFAFEHKAPWINKLISFSAIIATTGVLLVFQIGQPRIWMSMSRDGLLPARFGAIHPKYKTPHFSTIITGLLVAIPSLFIDADIITDLTSIGTLFAFVIVCAGVLFLPKATPEQRFRLPYINAAFILPIIFALFTYLYWSRFANFFQVGYVLAFDDKLFLVFYLIFTTLTILSIIKRWSLIPILGVLFCLYLMMEIPEQSWVVFMYWMAIGLFIYFLYGYRHSKMRKYVREDNR